MELSLHLVMGYALGVTVGNVSIVSMPINSRTLLPMLAGRKPER